MKPPRRTDLALAVLGGLVLAWAAVCCGPPLLGMLVVGLMSDEIEFQVSPDPPIVGEVRCELRLPHELLPDDHGGKRVEWTARPCDTPQAQLSGLAVEDLEEAHLFRFSSVVDHAGPWCFDVTAYWQDGRVFARDSVEVEIVAR